MYDNCGLKELAKAAGLRGETLTSPVNCSHFKLTHHFLLHAIYLEMLNLAENHTFKDLSEMMGQLSTEDVDLEKMERITGETRASKMFLEFVEKSTTYLEALETVCLH